MNKIWAYLIAVLVAVALFFGGMLLERKFQNDRYKEVEGRVKELENQKDSLLLVINSLQNETLVLQDSISKSKEKIVYIKIKSDEKVDSIRVLPLDSAMEFFTDQVSREDSPQG